MSFVFEQRFKLVLFRHFSLFYNKILTFKGIQRQEASNEPREVVEQRLETMKAEFERLVDGIGYSEAIVERCYQMAKERETGFHHLRGSMCRRVKTAFSDRLQERNFKGLIKFDHHPEETADGKKPDPTLTLIVNPEGGKGLIKRDMKTLSGGEKSFSTVSIFFFLLLIFDEFSCFLDLGALIISLQL